MTNGDAAPTSASERVEIMDVLRGVALFGVFLVNLTQFASVNVMSTEPQLLSLPSAPVDLALYDVLGWLFFDKANTIFAFLFGLGFYLQMQRLEARGADFEVVYLRRLCVLLAIGSIHVVFLWAWDILHLYALAGFRAAGAAQCQQSRPVRLWRDLRADGPGDAEDAHRIHRARQLDG